MTSEFGQQSVEELAFFVRSPSRLRVLGLLSDGDLTLAELRNRLSVSHSTAQRNLRDLVDRGYIAENAEDATYSLRLPGELIYRQLRDACELVESAVALRDFAHHFPTSPPVSPAQLPDFTVVTPDDDHPFRPTQLLAELLETDADVCLCNLACNPLYLDQLEARFRNPSVETELVVSESTVTRMREWCSLSPADLIDHPTTTLRVGESLPGFGIVLADRTAVLVSYGPDRKTRSALRATDEATELFRWTLDAYATQRSQSEPASE